MNLTTRICLVILLVIVACTNNKRNEPGHNNSSELSVDKVKLIDVNDQPVDLTKYKGKAVFINFWATWCKPCREEMPSIQKAIAILKGENIEFLFASDETKDEIEEFKSAHKYDFKYVRVESLGELNIMGLPTTFIFNGEGKISYSEMGYRKWDDKVNIELIQNIINKK